MADWLYSVSDIVSLVANSKAIIGGAAGGLALISTVGVIPRVGLGRAITLGWKSFFKTTSPLSVRKSEIQQLTKSIIFMKKGSYITIIGGKGNGKSCLIDTTLNRHFGVMKISTKSGADKDLIIDEVLREITGFQVNYLQPASNARRVLFFYNLIFKLPPIVVIGVPERLSAQNYADVPAAVRALADNYGLRVIVDGSPNSVPPELLTTRRATVMTVEPMSREQIESIPEFKILIDTLKVHKLDNVVWNVIGGSPIEYFKLNEALSSIMLQLPSETISKEFVDEVKKYLLLMLTEALNTNIVNCSENTTGIINFFRDMKVSKIPLTVLKKKGFSLDYPNKVFRIVRLLGEHVVEPASPAISLIITENIEDKDGMFKLVAKLSEESLNSLGRASVIG